MTNQSVDRLHPVEEFSQRLLDRLDQLNTSPVWSMTPDSVRRTLVNLARAEAQLAAARLRVLAEADRSSSTDSEAACSAADWVAVQTRQTRRDARSDLNLARSLEEHRHLGAATSAGEVNPAQARAIVRALDRLPETGDFAVSAEQRQAAEEHLVALAAHHDAKELARLGLRIFEVVAPEVADEFEGRVLAEQEALALRRTWFTLREDDEGTCHGRFRIPLLHGHMLQKMIHAIDSPSRPRTDGRPDDEPPADGDRLPTPVRHGRALCRLLESVPARSLPVAAGVSATVVVTMTLEQLTSALEAHGICTLDTGGLLTAGEARRLACSAGIIPAVLGGRSELLDLGRTRRLHSPAQRLAMAQRDGGCTAVGCDRPPSRCHAHHAEPWSAGGVTSVDNGRLLCGHHHRRVHDPAYEHHVAPGGLISFHRRT
jgi:hypothetical protein